MEGLKIEPLSDELQDGKCCKPNESVNAAIAAVATANSGIGDQIASVNKIDAVNDSKSASPIAENTEDFFEYTDGEWDAIVELKGLYLNTLENDIELQDAAHELEKAMEPQFNAIYGKRAQLLKDIRQQHSSSTLSKFWLVVLKTAFPELITKEDAPILAHLIDLRSRIFLDPDNKFTIEFVFEPNEYFSNEVLTKTYFLETMPNSEDPFAYNGAQVIGCNGCTINWKANYAQVINEWYSFSFFDFFEPPTVPSDPDDINFEHVLRVLEKDYECGYYLKSCVIPKAVLFFTGEIGSAGINCDSDSNETLCDLEDQGVDDDDDENAKNNAHAELDEAESGGEDGDDEGDGNDDLIDDYNDNDDGYDNDNDNNDDDNDNGNDNDYNDEIGEHEKTLADDDDELDMISLKLTSEE